MAVLINGPSGCLLLNGGITPITTQPLSLLLTRSYMVFLLLYTSPTFLKIPQWRLSINCSHRGKRCLRKSETTYSRLSIEWYNLPIANTMTDSLFRGLSLPQITALLSEIHSTQKFSETCFEILWTLFSFKKDWLCSLQAAVTTHGFYPPSFSCVTIEETHREQDSAVHIAYYSFSSHDHSTGSLRSQDGKKG